MKSEAEIRKAIARMDFAAQAAIAKGSEYDGLAGAFSGVRDALMWCIGDPNTFGVLMDRLDALDARLSSTAPN